jgi:NADH-quinone oxidoreductase subunit M
MIYERYHTRRSDEIGGLARRMPWLAFFLIFFTLTSIGLPGLNGFVSEFLVLLGAFTSASTVDNLPAGPLGTTYAILAAIGVILGAIYMLAMCQRVLFGPLIEPPGTPDTSNGLAEDLTKREIGVLVPIAALCLFIGVYPKPILDTMHAAAGKQIMANFYMHQADDADLDKSVVQSPFESLEDSATASVVSAFDSDHQTAAREVTP